MPVRPIRTEALDRIRVQPQRYRSLPPSILSRYVALMVDLTPIESEFATSEDAAAYDAWFRAKVERAMASTALRIPHDEVMAMARAVIDRHRPSDAHAGLDR